MGQHCHTFHLKIIGLRYVKKIVSFSDFKFVLVSILVNENDVQPVRIFVISCPAIVELFCERTLPLV